MSRVRLVPHLTHRSRPRLSSLTVVALLALSVSDAVAGPLTLEWTDTSGGQAAFNIERKTGASGAYASIGQQAAGATSYVDSAIVAGTTYCYRVAAFNEIGMSEYSDEACATTTPDLTVNVAKSGTGVGTVTSSPSGISCGLSCTGGYPGGTVLTLTASAASGSEFIGWSGAGCGGTLPCTVTGNGSISVTAVFGLIFTTQQPPPPPPSQSYTLSVNVHGRGLVSSPSGLSCKKSCQASYSSGTTVTLNAVPASGWQFAGWSGNCQGTGACVVQLGSSQTVQAQFTSGALKGNVRESFSGVGRVR
ncbi:MAG TPA: hypothetical protein VJT72_05630 [Pseudonocardiaceae bacterium]|nr:hypothetical protein [Pseudonocardiaceae bacterium]